jgi:2-alkyl-3-oxoalkanoate reductase
MADRSVLITGVNGFIAGHLAERLLKEGWRVRGTARRPDAAAWLANQGVEVFPADLMDRDALVCATEGCAAVVHAAAWTGGPELSDGAGYEINVDGTANVLAAAQETGVERLIYVSSVAVYGVNRSPVIDETAATPKVGQAYPDSKIVAEALVRTSGLPYVIIRPASTYGPRGAAWTLGPVDRIKAGRLMLMGRDTGLVTPGYIDNVVDGLGLALDRRKALRETFNLCDDRTVSYREFYMAYARMLGKVSLPVAPGPIAYVARLGAARQLRRLLGRPVVGRWSQHFRFNPSRFSVEKAKRVLGYRPKVGFEEGMRRTEAWLREANLLSSPTKPL